ncbi:MAG TPA: LPS export ABC transporter periplasmic protein LptC [Leptolyngbyaceae cyanobacterium]
MKKIKPQNHLFLKLALLTILINLVACKSEGQGAKKLAEDSKTAQNIASAKDFEGQLSFSDVTLDQVDEQGRPVWKVKAKQAIYTNNQKIAKVQNPIGDLFQDGKLVYQVTGKEGEVHENGEVIFLKGDIVATDIQNQVLLRGNELEWRPKEDILIVRNQLNGTHKQVQATAQEAKAFSKKRLIELSGKVVAVTQQEPILQLRTEHLIWQMEEQKIIGDRPLQIDRYVDKKITDRGTGERGDVDLKNKIATLRQKGLLNLFDPPLDVASDLIVWNLNAKTIVSDLPVRLFHRVQQVNLNASKGRVDLEPKIAYLTGNVYGTGQRPPSQMRTDRMTWYLPNETFEAVGNVFYKQVDPPLTLRGPKAIGQFKDQTIVITGGENGGRVVTEIIP